MYGRRKNVEDVVDWRRSEIINIVTCVSYVTECEVSIMMLIFIFQ